MLKNIVDIYIRLSDQDRDKKNPSDESESIRNQRKMLVDYCKKEGGLLTIFAVTRITAERTETVRAGIRC